MSLGQRVLKGGSAIYKTQQKLIFKHYHYIRTNYYIMQYNNYVHQPVREESTNERAYTTTEEDYQSHRNSIVTGLYPVLTSEERRQPCPQGIARDVSY